MRDRRGRIIYVGKANSLRKRVQYYFRDSNLRRASPKDRSLISSIHDLDYIAVRNEAEALLMESKLIKENKPRYNVSFRDDKRFILLNADPQAPFPTLKLCRIKRDDGTIYMGPYPSSASARAALDFTEKRFGLRKCSPQIPDKNTHNHCLNDIVRYCSAPCIGKVTQEQYHERFNEALAFLEGNRPEYLSGLMEQMRASAQELDFEKAAALRDIYLRIREIIKQKVRITSTPALKKELAINGIKQIKNILQLKKIPHIIEAYDVSNISGTYAVAGMVCFKDGMPHKNRYRRFRIKTVNSSNDSAMMAEVIRRRFKEINKQNFRCPDLILVDGGIPQLHAARHELSLLDAADIPVAGLAKSYEDIYWRDNEPPIRLAHDSSALKILQHLRDEAHRFAISYHKKLRNRLIRESALDDIAGIGKKRKTQLLSQFGSVSQIKKTSEQEIAAIPGFGRKIARIIKSHLDPIK